MDADFFSKLNKSGAQALLPSSATLFEREQLSAYVAKLRRYGHAISSDEVRESGEESGAIRVIHYKTCRACAKGVL